MAEVVHAEVAKATAVAEVEVVVAVEVKGVREEKVDRVQRSSSSKRQRCRAERAAGTKDHRWSCTRAGCSPGANLP